MQDNRLNDTHERFTRLFLASKPEILRYIMATVPAVSDAPDVLQETAAALWKKLEEYDGAMPFTPWACRFASLVIRSFLRRKKRETPTLDDVDIHDLHATILHLLGLDHEKLTYRYSGRDFRLTDVKGRVVTDILA